MSTELSIALAFGLVIVGFLCALALALAAAAKVADEITRDLAKRWRGSDLTKIGASRPSGPFHVETADGEVEVRRR